MLHTLPQYIQVSSATPAEYADLLNPEALAFLATLHREFSPRRQTLLAERKIRQQAIDSGVQPIWVAVPGDWQVAPVPAALMRRHVEITGPIDAKMIINALNSGADVFMADCEDANSPTWANLLQGHVNLQQAVRKTLRFEAGEKSYQLNEHTATLLVRPRGWHLEEHHLRVDNEAISASLFDFGLYFFHNAKELLARGVGPYFYLPKLQSAAEAELWNEVFVRAQDLIGIPQGSIRATVLIEHILAAFEMEAILYALRDHICGLNAGRWDYIFSIIKTFAVRKHFVLPDRAQITMAVPFMEAYCRRLVRTCHQRAAHAIGGMAAFIPSRRDAEVNAQALSKVREDKQRETRLGFDGTWVAHPDLVPVAAEVLTEGLKQADHQKAVMPSDVPDTALLDFKIVNGQITEAGLRTNLEIAIRYTGAWLAGMGAVAIHNLMEDAATAEISRSQIWQWLHQSARLENGQIIDQELVINLLNQELNKLIELPSAPGQYHFDAAATLLKELILAPDFPEFLTLAAYQTLASDTAIS